MELASIEPARPDDEPEVRRLLRDSGLPDADVAQHLDDFLVARSSGELIGVVGVELLGSSGLLRSLAVKPRHRGRLLGNRLCDEILALARLKGVETLYLLTTTAAAFFARRGFGVISRQDVPPAVQGTAEFASLCPATAVCMARRLTSETP